MRNLFCHFVKGPWPDPLLQNCLYSVAMSTAASTGKCQLCGQTVTRAASTRHVPLCWRLQTTPSEAAESFHFVVAGRYAKAYWMHVAVPATATLAKLDSFLRKTWLECCGHLSSFEIAGEHYSSSPMEGTATMKWPLHQLVGVGTSFSYQYDFGSTTELTLKVAGVLEGGTPKAAGRLLARNQPPAILCQHCRIEPASKICGQCNFDDEAWLCQGCARSHSCGEEMLLPVTNSPRVGVCAYSG